MAESSQRTGRLSSESSIASFVVIAAFAVVVPGKMLGETSGDEFDWATEKEFWSFQAPMAHEWPAVVQTDWPRQPLDYFILARLEENKLSPSPAADKRTLLRRLSFDLTGLPPAPEEVEAFLNDKRPDAYARWVDRILGSPRYGERMASLWLPLARYAEDQAHQVGSDTKFFYPNAYRYRQWVIDAFNRDLPYDDFVRLQIAADQLETAREDDLAALGFLGLGPKYYNRNRVEVMADEWEDRVDTVTRTMLGLTVACARCHDHKFEPITMRDYYGLAGVFASSKMVNKVPREESTAEPADYNSISADKMHPLALHMVEDGEAKDLKVFLRGNPDQPGPVAERRFLRILSEKEIPFSQGSGRKELAEALADSENPLTARVMVNRVWGHFFGQPLVLTPSNFGHSGQPPSHPELLDELAARFMENNWSIKELAREIVLSATYQQSSSENAFKASIDSPNELLWRMNRRRFSVEQWRDAVLYVSGELDGLGGQSLELDDPANQRRTVYARVSRLKLNDFLMQFDYPDANVHAETRSVTMTPMQKLFMLNSSFILTQARALAARLMSSPLETDRERVNAVYQLLYAREPASVEVELALQFLSRPDTLEMPRWEQFAQILLVSNEMLYLD